MRIEFSTNNAAFEEDKEWEILRVLKKIGGEIECGKTEGVIMDVNGNKIGKWEM